MAAVLIAFGVGLPDDVLLFIFLCVSLFFLAACTALRRRHESINQPSAFFYLFFNLFIGIFVLVVVVCVSAEAITRSVTRYCKQSTPLLLPFVTVPARPIGWRRSARANRRTEFFFSLSGFEKLADSIRPLIGLAVVVFSMVA